MSATLITMKNDQVISVRQDGSDFAEMQSLNEAIKILDAAKTATYREALPIFSKVNHAHDHLCKQLKTLLSE